MKGLWKPHPDKPPTDEPTSWGGKFTAASASLQRDFLPAFQSHKCCSVQAFLPSSLFQLFFFSMFPAPALPSPALSRQKFWYSTYTLVPLELVGVTKHCHLNSAQKKRTVSSDRRLMTVCSTSRERCFLICNSLLPMFADTQSPDFSPIPFPALLATSLFPCYTSNCLSLFSLFFHSFPPFNLPKLTGLTI